MTNRIAEASPRSLARLAALFQLLEAVTGTFGQVIVLDRFVVSGNAAATAANLLRQEGLYRIGFASCILGVVFHLAWALILHELLKPVGRRLSLFALLVMVVGCAMQALATLFYIAPLIVLRGGNPLGAFSAEQLQALALTFLRVNASAYDIYLVFFGFWCALIGVLIFRSTYLPRVLGVLLAISGLGWMTFLSPPLARHLFIPYIAGASALGEVPLMLWLLVAGVNVRRWKDLSGATGPAPN